MNDDWIGTTKLRFVERQIGTEPVARIASILQQWYAPDVPGYMRDPAVGEWRDVAVENEPL